MLNGVSKLSIIFKLIDITRIDSKARHIVIYSAFKDVIESLKYLL